LGRNGADRQLKQPEAVENSQARKSCATVRLSRPTPISSEFYNPGWVEAVNLAALSILDVLPGEGYNSRLPLDWSVAEQYEDFLRR
jgi:hypothetical protein